nr:butyrophilin-like protein 2 [Danio rerio]|eukprot:XP_017210159.2 butyrophilin-like protein 2 [Danio rerio]
MDLLACILISMVLMVTDGFTVHGPSAPLSAPLGSSVVLPCFVDEALPVEDLEVEWRRADSETLVHLYQDGESRPEVQQQDYHDRAHFFTEEIQHGNFSLRLDNLTAQDEGEYRCTVHSQQDSGEAVAQIKDVGFVVHGPSAPLSAPLGSSVVLPCYIDNKLLMEDLEVEWRRADSETLIHLYQDGESRAEVQQQDYHDRAHFFTEEIQHGNFSLRLDNLTVQDEGEYRCRVFIQLNKGETVVQIKDVERLLVSGSNRPASAYVGEDVTLNCSVDSHITPEHIEEVSWLKTDEDGDSLVLLYQNNETLPDSSVEQFRGRVEFFTAEISKGNFSLRLKSVRTEDKGVYRCQVFAGDLSANATVELERLGFSSLHIVVLVFCVAAGSGAVLLLCCLIYCRYKNTVTSSLIWNFQISLVLFPNICMCFAFIFWGFIEGFLDETIICSAIYILRPAILIWALPFLKYLKGA